MANPKNYIVQRHSPDWLKFDVESSRNFLRSLGFKETIVIDFALIWNRNFAVDYCNFRHRIKWISSDSYRAVVGATVLDLPEFERRRSNEDDLTIFVDDDDWLRGNVFEVVRPPASRDGSSWGSIVVGGEFNGSSESAQRQIEIRAITARLYTNNYAVTHRAIERLGLLPLLEHHQAQLTLQEGRIRPSIVRNYLSATNKHPCSTLSAKRHLESQEFLSDPRRVIATQRDALAAETFTHDTQWIAPMVAELLELLNDALRPAS